MKTTIYVLFLFTTLLTSSYAQNIYYFSSSQGNDKNNGLTSNSPKQTLAALQNILQSASPGDKFLLKRGDTWTTRAGTYGIQFTDVQGNSGSPIVIDAYGSGSKPIFDMSGSSGDYILYMSSTDCYYVTIRNLHLTTSSSLGCEAIHFGGASHNITIDSVDIDLVGEGIYLRYPLPNCIVENCTFENIVGATHFGGNGLFADASDLIVRNNYFYNIGYPETGTHHALYIPDCFNLLVQGNTFESGPNGYQGVNMANGDTVQIIDNTFIGYSWDAMGVANRDYWSTVGRTGAYGSTPYLRGLVISGNKFKIVLWEFL